EMKKILILGVVFAICWAITFPVGAQTYPKKPVSLVVPYPPGGNVDTGARIIAEPLRQIFGKPFIVENKAGAGGMIAGEYVAKAAPDGHTLFVGANGPILYSPLIYGRSPYEWSRDFAPISPIAFTPMALVVHPSVPVKSVKELFDMIKSKPGTLKYATPGAGTTNDLLGALLAMETGGKWITAHYKGNAPALNDLLGGQVDFSFEQITTGLPHIKAGKIRALAVTAEKRIPWLPEVPTLVEQGYKDAVGVTFTGVLAPAKTPQDVITKLNEALVKIIKDKDTVDKFFAVGAEARTMSPEDFRSYMAVEYARWAKVIKEANIKVQ
ncbi:MAG TPA: tripartite tricarboxylate transporter substrate binding protein, partial [Thermodesulfobacteriota bacterium]|nr:tripartite tricarboxylate transporter substrate binding protein [Thermodesulfobacteriota bacterium]